MREGTNIFVILLKVHIEPFQQHTHTKLFRIRSLFLRDAVFGCTVRPKIFNWSKPVRAIFCLAKVTLAFNEHNYNASCTNDHYKPLSMALAVLSFLERGCCNFLQNLHQTTKNPLIFKLASVAQWQSAGFETGRSRVQIPQLSKLFFIVLFFY